jgi:hypothetical protein
MGSAFPGAKHNSQTATAEDNGRGTAAGILADKLRRHAQSANMTVGDEELGARPPYTHVCSLGLGFWFP